MTQIPPVRPDEIPGPSKCIERAVRLICWRPRLGSGGPSCGHDADPDALACMAEWTVNSRLHV
jgi:hypothetical protein